jgi:hypothetical protein
LVSSPLPEEGPIQVDPASAPSEAPKADEGQDGDDAEVSREDSGSTLSPPPANSGEPSLDKKRKHLDELLSSSTSTPKNMPGEPSTAKASDLEIFDALDSCVLLPLYTQTFLSAIIIPLVDSKYFLLSDDDDPKKDVVAAPLLDALTVSKEPSQEEAMVLKSLTIPPAKSTPSRASKRLKKAAIVSTSLEVH